jgi:sucrose phosphorylase
MVYNFTLPPLTLHAMLTGDATRLSDWAKTLAAPSDKTTFFNFMASHDGIGLRPLEGILSSEEITMMATRAQAHGGLVSFRANSDGSRTPYELNIVYYDALNSPHADESQALQVDRFITSQAILLSLAGVPGVYVHSLFGSRNWSAGVAQTGRNRTINRRKFQRSTLESELADPTTVTHQVFMRYKELLQIRREEPAFHPNAGQQVLALHPALFSFVRQAPDATRRVLCVHNVSNKAVSISVDLRDCGFDPDLSLTDRVRGVLLPAGETVALTIPPCGMQWLVQETL